MAPLNAMGRTGGRAARGGGGGRAATALVSATGELGGAGHGRSKSSSTGIVGGYHAVPVIGSFGAGRHQLAGPAAVMKVTPPPQGEEQGGADRQHDADSGSGGAAHGVLGTGERQRAIR